MSFRKYLLECEPVPLQRPRHGNQRTWNPQKQIMFNCSLYLQNQHEGHPLFKGPLKLDAIFYMPIAVSLSKKKKEELKNSNHVFKPDIDNLIKFILDIGNEILYHDDCLFVEINAKKLYDDGNGSRTEFTITEL